MAASHVSFPAFVFQARDPRRGLTIFTDILGGGGGARPGAAGNNAIDTYTSNCALLPAEIAEMEYPWRIERTELVEGSGGEGRWRGGLAFRRDYRLLAEAAEGIYYVEQTSPGFGAAGRDGGAGERRRGCSSTATASPRGRRSGPARGICTYGGAIPSRSWAPAAAGSVARSGPDPEPAAGRFA